MLCKKETSPQLVEERSEKAANKAIRRGGRWKAWLKNSFLHLQATVPLIAKMPGIMS